MHALRTTPLLDGRIVSVPEGPFFVSPIRADISGIDFLSLGAVGEGLIAAGLPGITNVTRYIRPYAVAAWIAWQFNEHLKDLTRQKAALPKPKGPLFKAFREKAELLFSWCNKGATGAVGKRRAYPESTELVRLAFDNGVFGPINNASWFAPALYGPSFSLANGLGFIYSYESVYVPTPIGEEAARIIDKLMEGHPAAHSRIAHLTNNEGSLRDVEALRNALDLAATTAKERALFRGVLYQESRIGTWDGSHGNRATTMTLMLEALASAGPLAVEDVRESIALGITPAGKDILNSRLKRMQRLWFVLSLRQLERVALERLLRWLEFQLLELSGQWCDIDVVKGKLIENLKETSPQSETLTVGGCLEDLQRAINRQGGVYRAPRSDSRLSQFKLRRELEVTPESSHRGIPARAVYSLLHCVANTELCEGDKELGPMLKMGLRERVSLAALTQFARSREKRSISEFAQDVLTHLVYAQHLQTAASRVEDGKNKFRFAMDDEGLRLLIPGTSINGQLGTPDRILHALYLMTECGLIRTVGPTQFALT